MAKTLTIQIPDGLEQQLTLQAETLIFLWKSLSCSP